MSILESDSINLYVVLEGARVMEEDDEEVVASNHVLVDDES